MATSTDHKEILIRLSNDEGAAFEELFKRYSHKVQTFAFKLTRSNVLAEEILQDVFIKIWTNRKTLASVDHFPSYLYTVTTNHTLNVLKRLALEKTATVVFGREILPTYHDPDADIYMERQKALNRFVSSMPSQQRQVYTLCHQQGLKYEEVAKRLKISRLTVKTHMQQALRAIRSHFSIAANL